MDRNQIIGYSLLIGLMVAYFSYMSTVEPSNPIALPKDSIQLVKSTSPSVTPTVSSDSAAGAQLTREYGDFAQAMVGEDKVIELQNENLSVSLSTQGGKVQRVRLKNYFTWDKKDLYLVDPSTTSTSFTISTSKKEVDLYRLFYAADKKILDSAEQVIFTTSVGQGKTIQHIYTLPKKGYVIQYDVKLEGFGAELMNLPATLTWKEKVSRIEYDVEQARMKATVNYYTAADGFDYLSEASKEEEKGTLSNVNWFSLKQKFFNAGFIARQQAHIQTLDVRSYPMYGTGDAIQNAYRVDSTHEVIKGLEAQAKLPIEDLIKGNGTYSLYYGPNHFQICKEVGANLATGYEKNVYLGWPIVSWINRYLVIPVFNFLEGSFTNNYGLIIVLLVLLLKAILFPLSFKSYVSMAKMKALKPELDEIKAKNGEDQQAVQMEQMQLYQQVGINPLSGCLPMLMQMPILLAMFNFFPNSIELRQEDLWWANDLSSYDEFIKLPFAIPFYGAHVSMFTLLMTVSTLVYTYFNNQMSTVTGPMRYFSYIMPIIFLFVLNSFPAGLSFYYFASNIVTIGQQFIIRNFVDEAALRAKLMDNKSKNSTPGAAPKKNRFMARMEESMKAQETQRQLNKSKKK
ncbi:MAG: membrane protein insertase YidC [Cytophagaceae bacterium]|jgi:YidC/Oxa1 family membrane protein insertase|nr:membrane protein insertase YidC [Cytophagaceae bacterium]